MHSACRRDDVLPRQGQGFDGGSWGTRNGFTETRDEAAIPRRSAETEVLEQGVKGELFLDADAVAEHGRCKFRVPRRRR